MISKKPIAYVAFGLCILLGLLVLASRERGGTDKKGDPVERVAFLLDWKMGSFYAPYVLGVESGFYAEEGIDLELIEGQGAETSAKLIGAGTYKLGTCNAGATAIAVDKGIPIESVAIIEQDAVTALFSLAESNIVRPEDIIGKKLGVRTYDISHKEFLALMKVNGLDETKVTQINVGFELQPLLTHQVDVLYNYAFNMPVQLQQKGYAINSILVKDWGVKGYGSNIVVNRQVANESSDLVKRFLRASKRAWEESRLHPEAAIAALEKHYPELDDATALASLREQLKWLANGREEATQLFWQSDQRWTDVLKTYKDLGMIQTDISPNDLYSNRFLK